MPAPVIVLAAAAAIGALYLLKTATRAGYESAAYEELQRQGDFELRHYAAQTLVETPMRSRTRDRGSFRRLFDYIAGDNARAQKISMTTPVFVAPGDGAQAGSMAFVLSRDVAEAGAPATRSPDVALKRLAPQRVACLRFRGYRDEASAAAAESRLRAIMAERGLSPAGPARLAFYDPPWTPEPLRRNEIQIPVAP